MRVPKSEDYSRRDLHFHVSMGHGEWVPHDPGHPDSFHRNTIFSDPMKAHAYFIRMIKLFGWSGMSESEFNKSLNMWNEINDEMRKEHALDVMTFLGIEFNDLDIPMSLIACNGCIPYENN